MSPAVQGAKRCLDVFVAAVALAVLIPLLPLIALAILVESRGPVFVVRAAVGAQYRRPRGAGECEDARRLHDVGGVLLRLPELRLTTVPQIGAPARLTRVGRVLIKLRLAQAPRLLSVLTGDLALVGPRPLSPRAVAEVRQRVPGWDELLVGIKPGLLGPAQAQGRPVPGWVSVLRDRLQHDVGYAERLARATRVRDVLALDLSLVRACLVQALRSRMPLGHEVIRIDAPAQLHQVPVEVPAILLPAASAPGAAPRGPSVELQAHGNRVTAFWYPPRRHRQRFPALPALAGGASGLPAARAAGSAADLLQTAEEPFEARWITSEDQRDCQLLVVHALRADPALAAEPADELHVDLPGGLHEVAQLGTQLLPVWEALSDRRGESALPGRMTRLLLAGLARVAAGREDGRIALDVSIAADRIVLRFTALRPLPELAAGVEPALPRMVFAPSLDGVLLPVNGMASMSAAANEPVAVPVSAASVVPMAQAWAPQPKPQEAQPH